MTAGHKNYSGVTGKVTRNDAVWFCDSDANSSQILLLKKV